jgi:hypothetical protein
MRVCAAPVVLCLRAAFCSAILACVPACSALRGGGFQKQMYSYGNKVGLDTQILHQDTRLACFNSFFCWFFDKTVVSTLGPSIILESIS